MNFKISSITNSNNLNIKFRVFILFSAVWHLMLVRQIFYDWPSTYVKLIVYRLCVHEKFLISVYTKKIWKKRCENNDVSSYVYKFHTETCIEYRDTFVLFYHNPVTRDVSGIFNNLNSRFFFHRQSNSMWLKHWWEFFMRIHLCMPCGHYTSTALKVETIHKH